jgi:hypothetical protein
MASEVVSKLQTLVTGESKAARKKKAKAEAGGTAVPAAREQTSSEAGAGGSDPASKANGADSENAYVRELQKWVNTMRKLAYRRVEARRLTVEPLGTFATSTRSW